MAKILKSFHELMDTLKEETAENPVIKEGFDNIKPDTKNKVNAALVQAGFDGTRQVGEPSYWTVTLFRILQGFGIVADGINSADSFREPRNKVICHIGFGSGMSDPVSIQNSLLTISYQRLENGKYEVVAYLS